jgi:hypothetical protein
MTFREAFRVTQEALGLHHYTAQFLTDPGPGLLATTESDAANCTALVRVDNERCERASEVETTAVHECLHMLVADLKYAFHSVPDAADWQEEQLVRRLEPLIHRALFPPNPTIRKSLE